MSDFDLRYDNFSAIVARAQRCIDLGLDPLDPTALLSEERSTNEPPPVPVSAPIEAHVVSPPASVAALAPAPAFSAEVLAGFDAALRPRPAQAPAASFGADRKPRSGLSLMIDELVARKGGASMPATMPTADQKPRSGLSLAVDEIIAQQSVGGPGASSSRSGLAAAVDELVARS